MKKKRFQETKLNKFLRKNKSLCLILGLLLTIGIGLVFGATNYITDKGITTPHGIFENINATFFNVTDMNVKGNQNITGELNVSGNSYLSGNTNIIGTLNVTGNQNITGDLNLSGNITLVAPGAVCYNDPCTVYSYYNGTALISVVN